MAWHCQHKATIRTLSSNQEKVGSGVATIVWSARLLDLGRPLAPLPTSLFVLSLRRLLQQRCTGGISAWVVAHTHEVEVTLDRRAWTAWRGTMQECLCTSTCARVHERTCSETARLAQSRRRFWLPWRHLQSQHMMQHPSRQHGALHPDCTCHMPLPYSSKPDLLRFRSSLAHACRPLQVYIALCFVDTPARRTHRRHVLSWVVFCGRSSTADIHGGMCGSLPSCASLTSGPKW